VDLKNNTPIIKLSRTDGNFLAKLLELEVPEIYDGVIVIRKIVRQPGERAKVAVESFDDRIDPVGACVGMKGSRIHGIVRELKNENIDIINFTDNKALFIRRCLTPAKINSMDIDEENKEVSVYLDPNQVSLAIGKRGVNINLASKMVGYEINVYRDTDEFEEQDDIMIEEFADEIDEWIIDVLKGIGLDTARSVLELDRKVLVRRSDLEEETVDEILKILEDEFKEAAEAAAKEAETEETPPTEVEAADSVTEATETEETTPTEVEAATDSVAEAAETEEVPPAKVEAATDSVAEAAETEEVPPAKVEATADSNKEDAETEREETTPEKVEASDEEE